MTDQSPLDRFDRAAAVADAAIAGITPEQLDAPTPCPDWNVRQLLNHLVGGNRAFLSMQTGGEPVDRSADHLAGDPLGSFRATVADLRAAFAAEGALERVATTAPFGPTPGAVLVNMRVQEMMVHGWDISKATGQSTDLDPELATECLEAFRKLRATGRGADVFGTEQPAPPDATPADRLAAVAGRSLT